jgi:hypothetical protein
MAVVLTPLIYLIENSIDKYLGEKTAHDMRQAAMGKTSE